MEDKIIKILRQGREVQPSEEFRNRLRGAVLSSPQKRLSIFTVLALEFRENLKFGLAIALTTFLILMFLGGFKLPEKLTRQDGSLNGGGLISEIEKLEFQIQLGEARYFEESAMEIAAILNEIKASDDELRRDL